MIVVRVTEGAGNQLFQYACGRSLALRRGDELRIDPCYYAKTQRRALILDRLPIEGRLLAPLSVQLDGRTDYAVRIPRGVRKYIEPSRGFHDELVSLQDAHLYLDGYFQSEKYFASHSDAIRAEFSLEALSLTPALDEMERRICDVTSVSVHVRRTDYVDHSRYDVLGTEYYERAAAHLRDELAQPTFFVFSDDIEHCRKTLTWSDCVFVDAPDALTGMRLMSRCRHHVIANSSFSWWAAWLDPRADKRVLAPSQWFDPPNAAPIDDVLPASWTRVAVGAPR